jgi:hypothetical protein
MKYSYHETHLLHCVNGTYQPYIRTTFCLSEWKIDASFTSIHCYRDGTFVDKDLSPICLLVGLQTGLTYETFLTLVRDD